MFKFSLQTVLGVRIRDEKLKMKAMAEMVAVQQQIQSKIDQMENRKREANEELGIQKKQGTFSMGLLKMNYLFQVRMKSDLRVCYGQLAKAKEQVEIKRHDLIESSKKRKALDILREKEEKKYWANVARLELIQMDEIAGNRFNHKTF